MTTANPDRAVPERAVEASQGSLTNDTIAVSLDKLRTRSIAARVKPVRKYCVWAIRSQKKRTQGMPRRANKRQAWLKHAIEDIDTLENFLPQL